jgi:hypothetical protein
MRDAMAEIGSTGGSGLAGAIMATGAGAGGASCGAAAAVGGVSTCEGVAS